MNTSIFFSISSYFTGRRDKEELSASYSFSSRLCKKRRVWSQYLSSYFTGRDEEEWGAFLHTAVHNTSRMEPTIFKTFLVLHHLYPWKSFERVRGGPEEVPSQCWIKPSFGAEKIYSSSKQMKHTFNSSCRTRYVKKGLASNAAPMMAQRSKRWRRST